MPQPTPTSNIGFFWKKFLRACHYFVVTVIRLLNAKSRCGCSVVNLEHGVETLSFGGVESDGPQIAPPKEPS